MTDQAESLPMIAASEAFRQMRLSDCIQDERVDGRRVIPPWSFLMATDKCGSVHAIPRSVAEETRNGAAGSGKGKERAWDPPCDVEEHLVPDEKFEPFRREVHDGITMCCAADQPSPFFARRSSFFAVDFDDNTFVDSVTFSNCVLINVSFKGCILSKVGFTNIYLQDMEFIDCVFNDFTWLSKGEFNQTWTGETFEQKAIMGASVPGEVGNPIWFMQMKQTQIIPEKVEGEPSAEYMRDLKLIHETVEAGRYSKMPDPDAEPGNFDFSKLGNMVYEKSDSAEHQATLIRKMTEWETFAEEQVQERQRVKEDEALRKAMSENLAG